MESKDKGLKVDVWDWVVTRDGKTRQITHDDMSDLPHEKIARHATEEEIKKAKKRPSINKDMVCKAKTIYEQKLATYVVDQEQYIHQLESFRSRVIAELEGMKLIADPKSKFYFDEQIHNGTIQRIIERIKNLE